MIQEHGKRAQNLCDTLHIELFKMTSQSFANKVRTPDLKSSETDGTTAWYFLDCFGTMKQMPKFVRKCLFHAPLRRHGRVRCSDASRDAGNEHCSRTMGNRKNDCAKQAQRGPPTKRKQQRHTTFGGSLGCQTLYPGASFLFDPSGELEGERLTGELQVVRLNN